MDQELHNDLIATWNEVEEAQTSLATLSDTELIESRKSIQTRLDKCLHWLNKYVSENDVIKDL